MNYTYPSMAYRWIRFVTVLACLLWLPACSDTVPSLNKLPDDAVVVAFGDSLTYGTGAKDNETYPYYLSQIIQRDVINAGNPGELSAEGRQRLPQVLDKHQPDLLILCHGGNDLLRKKNREKLTANLKAMIGQAKQRGIQVMLIGVPEPALFLLESAPFYAKIAHSENIPLEREALPAIESNDTLKSDPIHPNAAGYRKLAQAIAKLLKTAGAV